ncbi:hypothetical protein Hhel01_02125 [Haloferula helveola]
MHRHIRLSKVIEPVRLNWANYFPILSATVLQFTVELVRIFELRRHSLTTWSQATSINGHLTEDVQKIDSVIMDKTVEVHPTSFVNRIP